MSKIIFDRLFKLELNVFIKNNMEINVNKFEVCGVWERKRKMCW